MISTEPVLDDVTYDLVSMHYHALSSARHHARYEQDALAAGELEIAEFARSVAAADRERAAACYRLLVGRLTDPEQQGASAVSELGPLPGVGEPGADLRPPDPSQGAGGHL